jgi:hypothetical protein
MSCVLRLRSAVAAARVSLSSAAERRACGFVPHGPAWPLPTQRSGHGAAEPLAQGADPLRRPPSGRSGPEQLSSLRGQPASASADRLSSNVRHQNSSPSPLRRQPHFLLSIIQGAWRWVSDGLTPDPVSFDELSPHRTEVRIGSTRLVLDTRSRLITQHGTAFLRFEQIRSIDVVHQRRDNDGPEQWRVRLRTGLLFYRTLLVTTDDADASILAARLATITGKRVYSY